MQKYHLFKQVALHALMLSAVSFCFAASEVETKSSGFLSSSQKSYEELYSENSYYQQYNLVTETRIRYHQPLQLSDRLGIDVYGGANLQYQSSGAQQKYFDNAMTPYVGIQGNLFKRIFLQLQEGVRTVINESRESNTTQWDPRVILSAGDFWHWPVQQVFTEAYGEVAYVPRLDVTPVSTGWAKQGYRFKSTVSVNLDPYAEFYIRESRSPELGPSMAEARIGLRSQWFRGSWKVAALVYQPVNRKKTRGDVEGLLVFGGVL